MNSNHVKVGTIVSKHGYKGFIKISVSSFNFDQLPDIKYLFIDINNCFIPFMIEEIKSFSNNLLILKLVEIKKESSLAFIAGVFGVVLFTYVFAYSLPKQQSEDLVAASLSNTIAVTDEVLKGAEIYNQMNCQSCHTQNVRVLIPDSQNGKVLKNKYAEQSIVLNTGLIRIGPDLSSSGSRLCQSTWHAVC